MSSQKAYDAENLPKPLELLSEEEIERKRYISKVMTHTLSYLTHEFVNDGFDWLLPVIFSESTDPLRPDPGASIEKRIVEEIYGHNVNVTASMIVHKMAYSSLVHPKMFALSPNVRIEKKERAATGRHLYEFTQLDFEVRDASSEDIRNLVEGKVRGVVSSVKGHMDEELKHFGRLESLRIPETPFKVFDRQKLESDYGENWEAELRTGIPDPVWVTNLPREFYDYEDFNTGIWDNYDLFLPTTGEVLSGAKREWEYEKIVRKMDREGVPQENYKVLLKLAKEGRLKHSAGAGIGIERLVGWIVNPELHIGEVQPFPRNPGTVYNL